MSLPRKLLIFFIGIIAGILLTIGLSAWLVFQLPGWLVVDEKPVHADIIVVLGGGGGSRLRKGLSLYDQGYARSIVLVDNKARYWKHIEKTLCKECDLAGKPVVILENSVNTQSDAELVFDYAMENAVKSILVVTDPYHTRRSSVLLRRKFGGQDISLRIVSSGDFGALHMPQEPWWKHESTLATILAETSKLLYLKLQQLAR
jgi:uncharacterized SAM-binding protein YcdF (DUF218 family)